MARDRYSYSSSYARTQLPVQRIVIALLFLTGITLLVLAKTQHPVVTGARAKMLDMMRPVLSGMSRPVTATKGAVSSAGNALNTAEDNKRLTAENDTLRHWQSVAMTLKAENESLRSLMEYQPVEKVSYVTAKIIGQSPVAFGHKLTINAGKAEGVKSLQPVIDAYGLIGRVVEMGNHSAEVMLLSDVGSRVPVVTGKTRNRAILSGTGDELMRLTFLAEESALSLGEPVMTTDEGGLIPAGIAVGHVFKRDGQGYLVKPLRPLARTEYVRIIQQQAD